MDKGGGHWLTYVGKKKNSFYAEKIQIFQKISSSKQLIQGQNKNKQIDNSKHLGGGHHPYRFTHHLQAYAYPTTT